MRRVSQASTIFSASLLAFAFFGSTPAWAQWGALLDEDGTVIGPAGKSGRPQPLPYFDARFDAEQGDVPAEFVLDALTEARTGLELLERQNTIQSLTDRIRGLRVDDHEFFGTPHFVASTRETLTEADEEGVAGARRIARDFVMNANALFEIGENEWTSGRWSRDFSTTHSGIRHLTLQQRIEGIDLFGAELRANVTRQGELINLSSSMLPEPDGGFAVSPLVLSARDAILTAAASVGIDLPTEPKPAAAAFGIDRYQEWQPTPGLRSDETVTTSLVHFPLTRTDIRTAWSVLVPEIGIGNTYEILVDATTGSILRRWNRLHFACSSHSSPAVLAPGGQQDASYRVFDSNDSPRPGSPGNPTLSNNQFPVVSRDFVTVPAGSILPFSPEGWISDGENQTLGNNCDAHSDLNADNQPELPRPQGSPFRVFDFPLDLGADPTVSVEASITNLFYLTNVYHDRLYALGFDEASGNFQQNNFGNGGFGGDRVQADALDGFTTGNPQLINNANFGTGGDGSTGRCQMFGWSGPNPDRDGSYDSDIVYHELSHGLSIRLSGGTVFGEQSGGMGEGWGDFFGLSLNSEASDPADANYPMGPYATFRLGNSQSNYFYGIRRLPYTTDMSVNPLTYADIDPAQISVAALLNPILPNNADAVHAVGEVWCLALWECRNNLIDSLGHAAGNEEMMRLVVDGLKLMPSNPNMLQARDAILQSDQIVNGAANRVPLWQGFAKRGLGFSAVSPSGSTTTGVVEAFDTPAFLDFTYPNGLPTQLSVFNETTFRVDITGVGSTQPVDGSATLTTIDAGGVQTTVPLTLLAPGGTYEGTLPAAECFETVEFFLETDSNLGLIRDPSGNTNYAAVSFEELVVALEDNFQSNQGWTVSTTASDGGWERGVPQDNGRGDPPADFDGSGFCFLSDNDPTTANSDIDNGTTTLTSPAMDVASGAVISWAYWLNDTANGELNGNDSLDVEFATDAAGTNWAALRSYGTALSAWRQDSVTVGTQLPASSTLRLRFIAKDLDDQNVVETGLDAFLASELVCEGLGTPFCFGDGSGTPCPCGNNVGAGLQTGCLNSSGGGCQLLVSGEPSASQDTLSFNVDSATPSSFGLLVSGDNQLGSGAGLVAFDGLRCVGGNFQRHGSRPTNAFGQSVNPWGPPAGPVGGLIAASGFTVGQTRNFQVFFRETDGQICLTGLNTSNGFSLTIRP